VVAQAVAAVRRGGGDMQCPKCENTSLKGGKIASRNLHLDACPECKGMWFDAGELAQWLGERAEKDFQIPTFAATVPGSECPRCSVDLYEFCYPGTLTLVDACKQCEGIWLDSKEWKAIGHARDESNKINCPKCDTRQMPSDSCKECGIFFAKYNPDQMKQRAKARISEKKAEDEISGLKGYLLGMIEDTIYKLS